MFIKTLRLSALTITIAPVLLVSCNNEVQSTNDHIRLFDIDEIYLHRGYTGEQTVYPVSWTMHNILNSFDLQEDNKYVWNFDDFELTEQEKSLTNKKLLLQMNFFSYFDETWSEYWFANVKNKITSRIGYGELSNEDGYYDAFLYSPTIEEYTKNYPNDPYNVFYKKLKNTKAIHIRNTWHKMYIDLHTKSNEFIAEELMIHETENLEDFSLRASSSLVDVNLPGAKVVHFESEHQLNSIQVSEGTKSLRISVKQSWTNEITKDFFPISLLYVKNLSFGMNDTLNSVSFPDNINFFGSNALSYQLGLNYLELPIDFEYEFNAFNQSVINAENSTIVIPRKFNNVYHKNRMFGAGHWERINFVEK